MITKKELLERSKGAFPRAKTNTKSALFKLIVEADRVLPERRKHKVISVVSRMEDLRPFRIGNERLAASRIRCASPELQTADNTVSLITRRAVHNYISQVVEVSGMVNMANKGQEVEWPKFEEPEVLPVEVQEFFETSGVLVTMHSANPFSAIRYVAKLTKSAETGKSLGAFMEKLPDEIERGYKTVCQRLGITTIEVDKEGPVALSRKFKKSDFIVTHIDRRGGNTVKVKFFGEDAEFSGWVPSLTMSTNKPVLPLAVVVEDKQGKRYYKPVFGHVLKPNNFADVQTFTQAIIGELEKIVRAYPSSFYFFSPLWTDNK